MSEPTPEAVEKLAAVVYGDGGESDHRAWLRTIDGSPNSASYDIARDVFAAGYVRDAAVLVLREQVSKQGAMIARIKERVEEESPCLDRYLGAETCDHPGCVLERDVLEIIDPEASR